MILNGFIDELYKNADKASEIAGSMGLIGGGALKNALTGSDRHQSLPKRIALGASIGAMPSVIGGAIGAMLPEFSKERQEEVNKKIISNYLPGVGAYRLARRRSESK